MKKTGIFYGSSTGTCEDLANQIADKMGVAASDVYSADKLSADLVKEYDLLILGTSTWGDGELQDDWYDGIKVLKSPICLSRVSPCSAAATPNPIATPSATEWASCTKI